MEEKKLEDSVVKAHSEDIMEEPDKVSFHYDDTQNAMVGEAGLDQAPDGGCEAWTVILGAACGEFAIFGMTYSVGLFLRYYNEYVFVGQMDKVSWIGAICSAFVFSMGAFSEVVINKLGFKKMLMVATLVCPLALMLASVSTQIWHFYLTQGLMYGIGASFGFFPCIGSGQEWFSRRRGTAVGLTLCGAGIGGLVVSNVFQALVSNGMDFRWALRILGFMCLFFLSVSTLLVKRAPMSDEKREKLRAEATMKVMLQKYCHILKNPQYIMIIAMGFVASFAYSIPLAMLPSFAKDLGLDPWIGTNLSAIVCAVNSIAKLSMGVAGDFVGRINALTVCMVGCCITSLTIWVNAKGEAATWIYAILYGCFGGGYLTLTPACLPQIVGYDYTVPANGLLFSLNVFGYLFGAPITSALINHSSPPNYMYAGLYVGIVYAIAAALCITLRVLKAGWNPLIKV